ncbi:MAG TPA: KH domain-containing protein [Actinomycetota bacterium]|nr:KH domain-containing protein [Actinomycetota bacterium]HEV8622165.1 KH domain-containing protein [Actinomycetota bacterium]HSL66844.1 KH domain-containing protein [Actinomycetota bacterium]
MKELLEYIARELVENPDAVEVNEVHDDRGILLQLTVDPEDMGKVIGKGGRTARAIRQVVKAAAIREGVHAAVEIVDQG